MWIVIKKNQKIRCGGCGSLVILSENDTFINIDYFNKKGSYIACTCGVNFGIKFLKENGVSLIVSPKLDKTTVSIVKSEVLSLN